MSDKLEVSFKAVISEHEFCSCDACHDVTRVMKVSLPRTKFHNGTVLTTKYSEYWLCARCRTKLAHALDWPEGEKTNG